MKQWLRPARYHWFALLLMMALCSVGFAWLTYGLIALAMANVEFLVRHGLLAVMEGGFVQFVLICAKGLVALILYLGFKVIEHELTQRWRGKEDHQLQSD
jgi:hypothetical protein